MIKKYFIIIMSCIKLMMAPCFAMEPYIVPLDHAADVSHPIDMAQAPYTIHATSGPAIYNIAEIQKTEANKNIANTTYQNQLKSSLPKLGTAPTLAQEIFLQEHPTGSLDNNIAQLPASIINTDITIAQENFNPFIQQQLVIPSKTAPKIQSPLPPQSSGGFSGYINNIFLTLIKKSVQLSLKTKLVQLSFADIISISLKQLLYQVLNLPEKFGPQQSNSINNFKLQIQYLSEQIQNYNNTTSYTDPEKMLLLIECIHQFLKENNIIHFSPLMFQKLDAVSNIAATSSNLFKNQNIIFSSFDAPVEILSYFKSVIKLTNDVSKIKKPYDVIHAIYDTHGSMDKIIQTWNAFQLNPLYATPINREYAAFLTFLLLFENSVIAASIILDQTSTIYKTPNPVPVIINIA